MAVYVYRGRDRRMSETLLRDLRMDAISQQLSRMGMSQVVEAQTGYAGHVFA